MAFLLISAFALECIALIAGVFLLAWLNKSNIQCKFAKFIGIFVVSLSFLGIACTGYHAYEYRKAGFFDPQKLIQMHSAGKMDMGMMKEKSGMMEGGKCPMMEKMMMGAESKPASNSSEHESHH